jgi:hypothetical protein
MPGYVKYDDHKNMVMALSDHIEKLEGMIALQKELIALDAKELAGLEKTLSITNELLDTKTEIINLLEGYPSNSHIAL